VTTAQAGDIIDVGALGLLRDAALSRAPVSLGSRRTDSPHEFYRYPARFSPDFACAAIKAFTAPGSLVVDPFVGGGTTAVEAVLAGRQCFVADVNPLATFVTRVKLTPLSPRNQQAVRSWMKALPKVLWVNQPAPPITEWAEQGYLKDLTTRTTWRITKLVRQALAEIDPENRTAGAFCRCVVLRTAQWALDMRSSIPTVAEFRSALLQIGEDMLAAACEYAVSLPKSGTKPIVINSGLPGLAGEFHPGMPEPRLILTSPPYPGVYVNYHRWKLLGRHEIRAPYWIADQRDGNGLAHYTMHARAEPTLNTYFSKLQLAFTDLARIASPSTTLVQLVGFSAPEMQLSRYLDAMTISGFEEQLLPELATHSDGRLWRSVPGRRCPFRRPADLRRVGLI